MKRLTPDSPELKSADLVAENIERLRELFPEAFANEGKIDFDVLRQLLGDRVDDREERYGLNWHGKRAARQLALTPSTGTLRPCPEESVDWDTTQNIFIEGDNLEVLKLLQKSYGGKVKLIYIDPPYNTGKDFVYPDKFQDSIKNYLEITGQLDGGQKITSNTEASGRFHTDWLNMMYARLKVAHTLLRDDGVIFISIDDAECANLRLVMDELFGQENFVANVIWQKKYAVSSDAKGIPPLHDHILVYQKTPLFVPRLLPRTEKQDAIYKNPDNDPRGLWRPDNLTRTEYRERDVYPITSPKTGKVFFPPPGASWRHPQDEVERMIADNRIWFGKDGNSRPAPKRFLSEVRQGVVASAWWPFTDVGHNDESKKELQKLFEGRSPFDTPKPTRLVRRMLDIVISPEAGDIVMDFFAGSGTTGDAVLQAKATQGFNARYVLVQLPEPLSDGDYSDIAAITKERLRRARKQVLTEAGSKESDYGFRVYKLDSGNVQPWEASRETLAESLAAAVDHVKPDRSEGDLLYDIILKHGLDLCAAIEEKQIGSYRVHSVGGGAVFACLGCRITAADVEQLADGIAKWRDDLAPANPELSRVVFRDSAFETDVAKTNLALILKERGFDEKLVVSL